MSEDLAWIFLPVYGPMSPWEHGLTWCMYEGWVLEWRPPEYYDYDKEHYMGW